jgi:SAM-dependent methyltransferase
MPPEPVVEIVACRACGSPRLTPVFDLGLMPLSDGFTASAEAADPTYPLAVVFCEGCALAQLRHTVNPRLLFTDDYHYFSSYTDTVVENAARNVAAAFARKPLGAEALVVELASNDGYLLQHVQARGVPVLGIDPAKGVVDAARARGIETLHDFFTRELARRLVADGHRADIVFANNVLAHVADTGDFVEGIAELLKDDGVAVVEVPHLLTLLEHTQFDTIYHEHLCYFSATALDRLFRGRGLYLNDVERLDIHGGSLRLFVEKRPAPRATVTRLLEEEARYGLTSAEAFTRFAWDVRALGRRLTALLDDAKARGETIAGYGAAAKGTILLNTFGIGTERLDYVVDRNPHKHGLHVPGVKLPIRSPAHLGEAPPDLLVVLPWNHKAEIMRQLSDFGAAGGAFLIPVPEPEIVRPSVRR